MSSREMAVDLTQDDQDEPFSVVTTRTLRGSRGQSERDASLARQLQSEEDNLVAQEFQKRDQCEAVLEGFLAAAAAMGGQLGPTKAKASKPTKMVYKVEISKSGRAECAVCGEKIVKAVVRCHVTYPNRMFGSWQHLKCTAFDESITCGEDLDGYELLKEDEHMDAVNVQIAEAANGLKDSLTVAVDPEKIVRNDWSTPLEPPDTLMMPLLPYQKEGLGWMVHQEGTPMRGGILADEMGMGKTIQMISLLLTNKALSHGDPDAAQQEELRDTSDVAHDVKPETPMLRGGNLIVVPTVALRQWQSELALFCRKGSLSVAIYHGASRNASASDLCKSDIVLTSYKIVEIEHRKATSGAKIKCSVCGQKYYEEKYRLHRRYFCGKGAQRTAEQAKQQRKSDKEGNATKPLVKRPKHDQDGDEGDNDVDMPCSDSGEENGYAAVAVVSSSSAAATSSSSKKRGALKVSNRKSTKSLYIDETETETETEDDSGKGARLRDKMETSSAAVTTLSTTKKSQNQSKGQNKGNAKKIAQAETTSDDTGKGKGKGKAKAKAKPKSKAKGKSDDGDDDDDDFDVEENEQSGDDEGDGGGSKPVPSAKGKRKAPKEEEEEYYDSEVEKEIRVHQRNQTKVAPKSILHDVSWLRVVLDEAHNVKDRQTSTAKAVFGLVSLYKWCLTGTPLQNRVGELFSLVRFLRIDPHGYYFCSKKGCDCKRLHYTFKNEKCTSCNHAKMQHFSLFNKKIMNPIKNYGFINQGARAMAVLKHEVLDLILLRRTKTQRQDDIQLPPRVVRVRQDRLSPDEEDFYTSVFSNAKTEFDTYVSAGTVLNNYANIFEVLMRLRQAIDHPYLVIASKTLSNNILRSVGDKNEKINERRKQKKELSAARVDTEEETELFCELCKFVAEDARRAECSHVFCRECVIQYCDMNDSAAFCPTCKAVLTIDVDAVIPSLGHEDEDEDGGVVGGDDGNASFFNSSASTAATVTRRKKGSILNRIDLEKFSSSTKLEALMQELHFMEQRDINAKAIVFSQFTSMLELAEYRVGELGKIGCGVLRGDMSIDARDSMVKRFNTDPTFKVLLVSLKAGGVALNLTVASHAFLLDLWWNPAAEYQAIDRTHRFGQHKPVYATRFVIENTIEERILSLQEKKRLVFESTIGGDEASMGKLTAEDLRFLFQ